MFNIFRGVENWNRDLTSNFAVLDDQSTDPDLRPPSFAMSVADVAELVQDWAAQTPRWSVKSRLEIDAGVTIHLTHKTLLLRFTDDVVVRLQPQSNGTLVHAESRSRIGKGDLGQNPRNLKELVRGLKAQAAKNTSG